MSPVTLVHVVAGGLALGGGYAALFSRKGAALHRRFGLLFVGAMLVMGASATVLAVVRGKGSGVGGAIVAYFVLSALTALRPPTPASHRLDRGLAVLAVALAAAQFALGIRALASPHRMLGGVPAPALFVTGMITLLGAIGDARMFRRGPLVGRARLRRHLWRMCFACFMAAGSFFLGQARVIPKPLRIMPILAALAIVPLLAMPYWIWRTRARVGRPPESSRRGATTASPTPTS